MFTFQNRSVTVGKPLSVPFTHQVEIVQKSQTIPKITSASCSVSFQKTLTNQYKINFQTINSLTKISKNLLKNHRKPRKINTFPNSPKNHIYNKETTH